MNEYLGDKCSYCGEFLHGSVCNNCGYDMKKKLRLPYNSEKHKSNKICTNCGLCNYSTYLDYCPNCGEKLISNKNWDNSQYSNRKIEIQQLNTKYQKELRERDIEKELLKKKEIEEKRKKKKTYWDKMYKNTLF